MAIPSWRYNKSRPLSVPDDFLLSCLLHSAGSQNTSQQWNSRLCLLLPLLVALFHLLKFLLVQAMSFHFAASLIANSIRLALIPCVLSSVLVRLLSHYTDACLVYSHLSKMLILKSEDFMWSFLVQYMEFWYSLFHYNYTFGNV